MAMDNESRLISAIITTGDISPVVERGLTPDWLYEPEQQAVMRFILEHVEKYGSVPTRASLRSEYPSYKIVTVSESPEYLIDKVAEWNRANELKAAVEELADMIGLDQYEEAATLLATSVVKVAFYSPRMARNNNVADPANIAAEWERYDELTKHHGLLGYPTGFPTIDKATLGLQKGQLVTVLAQAKVGKTSLCLAMANTIYVAGLSVLFISFEMGIDELTRRQRALMAHISFTNLQSGNLSAIEEKQYVEVLDAMEHEYGHPFIIADASTGASVSAIEAQMNRFEPDVVFVDGIYMLTDEVTGDVNTAQAITNNTRSLKRLATRAQVPIVINTQALASKSRGQRITADSAGYSSSFGQDSDVVIGLERVSAPEAEVLSFAGFRVLKVLSSRNSGLAEVELIFDWATGTIEEQVVV